MEGSKKERKRAPTMTMQKIRSKHHLGKRKKRDER